MSETKKICKHCKEWKPNIKEINNCIIVSSYHHSSYSGKPFKFCPWCGEELIEEEVSDV